MFSQKCGLQGLVGFVPKKVGTGLQPCSYNKTFCPIAVSVANNDLVKQWPGLGGSEKVQGKHYVMCCYTGNYI